jgi:hypothetical protein
MSAPALATRDKLLALLFMLGSLALGVFACLHDYNPSFGARHDFFANHVPTIEQFRTLPWARFMWEMDTASGPLYYLLLGSLPLDPLGLRLATLGLHIASAGGMLWLALKTMGRSIWPWVFAGTFFISPFQLGPALWAHPETLATLMFVAAVWLDRQSQFAAASVIIGLAVGCRQTAVGILGAMALRDIEHGRIKALAVKAGVTLAVLAGMLHYWHALIPPICNEHQSPNARTLLVSLALMCVALNTFELKSSWLGVKRVLIQWLIALPLCVLIYNLSGPFERGGFIFGILDQAEAQHLGWALVSPMVISLIISAYFESLRREPWTLLTVLGTAATLGISKVFYVKYIDFYVWPIALSMLVYHAGRPQRLKSLISSLAMWSIGNLIFVSLRY